MANIINNLTDQFKSFNKDFGVTLLLKNRFDVIIEKNDDISVLSALQNPSAVISNSLEEAIDTLNPFSRYKPDRFTWGNYVESISNTATGNVFSPVKYSDVYDYVKGFEQNNYVTITFILLDANILSFFISWVSKIYNRGFGYYDDYAKYNIKISLKSLDTLEDFNEIILKNCYPVNYRFGELNSETNGILRLHVDFVFREFKLGSESFFESII